MKKSFLLLLIIGASFSGIAQEGSTPCDNKYGADSAEAVKNVSMFNQYYAEKNYVAAYPYWLYLFENAPCVQKRITYAGPFIVKRMLKDVKNKQGKQAYYARIKTAKDTIFMNYEMRIAMHGQEGNVKAKWAKDICTLTPKDRLKGLAMFEESIALEGNKTKYNVPKDYIYQCVKQNQKDSVGFGIEKMLEALDLVSPIIDFNIAQLDPTAVGVLDSNGVLNSVPGITTKDSVKLTKWLKTKNSVTKLMLPYLNCDKITEMKEPMFAENSENAAWLKSTLHLLDRGGCDNKDFYVQCSEKLYELEPSSEAALALAKAFGRKGEKSKATSYYEKAAELATDDNAKYDIYIKLAKQNKNLKSYTEARSWARKALGINPSSGEAYILIGDLYAASARSCGSGKLGSNGVYLVAVDKYVKARSVDASVADEANGKISKYSGYFPDKENAFFLGINPGDGYSVGCWIGESTTVRVTGG